MLGIEMILECDRHQIKYMFWLFSFKENNLVLEVKLNEGPLQIKSLLSHGGMKWPVLAQRNKDEQTSIGTSPRQQTH